ncbi:MAG: hypothetical protein QM805_17340 [Pseudomonas sp.]
MTFGLWQAHLALALLLFLLIAPLGNARHWQALKLAMALAVTFIPIDGLPLAIIVRSFTHDLSTSLLVLLAGFTLARLGMVQVRAPQVRDLLLAFALLALVLYPASLGLSYLDPFRWGYEPTWLLLAMAVLTLAFLLRGNGLGAATLLLATLAYALRGDGSGNYWNYLIDPLLALFAWVFSLSWAARALLRRACMLFAGERNAPGSTDLAEMDR